MFCCCTWVFFFSFFHTNGLLRFPPTLPSSERVVLQCSWCKSPAQTAQACQQSAADSSNPSSQSSYPSLIIPRLWQSSAARQTSAESALNGPRASSLCVEQTDRIHHGPLGKAFMHALFHRGLKESSLREKSLFL